MGKAIITQDQGLLHCGNCVCGDFKRTLLFERRNETFRDNFIVTVHVNDKCEMTTFGSKKRAVYVELFGGISDAWQMRCENLECQEIVKRCEYSEDMKFMIVVFALSIQIDTVLYSG